MIRADVTLSIQLPKLSFLFPENEDIVGEWQLLDLQLKKAFIDTAQSLSLIHIYTCAFAVIAINATITDNTIFFISFVIFKLNFLPIDSR